MLTRRIDAALMAMTSCRERVPDLRDVYQSGSPERSALDNLLAALERADHVLMARDSHPSTVLTPPMEIEP
jgi:hypothetical protein